MNSKIPPSIETELVSQDKVEATKLLNSAGSETFKGLGPRLFERGFTPLPVAPRTKRPVIGNWAKREIPKENVNEWATNQYPDYGVGIRCDHRCHGLDVDVYDEKVSAAIYKRIRDQILGGKDLIHRIGQQPKFLVPCCVEGIEKKICSSTWIDEKGRSNCIEILTTGQQYVAYGIHEGTGEPYRWVNGQLEDIGIERLPTLSMEDLQLLFAYFDSLAGEAGWDKVERCGRARELKWSGPDGDKYNRPGDVYNRDYAHKFRELVESKGWVYVYSAGRNDYYRRPGKREGHSACWDGTTFYVFTSSDSHFEPERGYSLFSVYTILCHQGDPKAAAKELYKLGIGRLDKVGDVPARECELSSESTMMEWEEPVLLDNIELPPFEEEWLPDPFCKMVVAVAEATETPPEMAAFMGLAAVATSVQKKVVVEPREGYREPLSMWFLVAMEPGERKSAVTNMMTKPLFEWEERQLRKLKPEINKANIEAQNKAARINALRKKYATAQGSSLEEIGREIHEEENNSVVIPSPPQIVGQDITTEQAAVIMSRNGDKIGIISSEGVIIGNMGGRYSNIPNFDLFLQGHAGDPVRVDRGSREPIKMLSPAVSIGLAIQPRVIKIEMSRGRGFRGKGLLARFMYALPKSRLGYRTLETDPVPDSVGMKYQQMLLGLLNLEIQQDGSGQDQPRVLRFSPAAYHIWQAFSRGVEKQLRPGRRFEYMTDWAGKLPGAAARLAGLLHCIENADNQISDQEISDATMERALGFAAFAAQHAIAFFDLLGLDPDMENARIAWGWISRNRNSEFSFRDCFQGLKGGPIKNVKQLRRAFELLVDRHYIRLKEQECKGLGRPSAKYEVNPSLTGDWDELA